MRVHLRSQSGKGALAASCLALAVALAAPALAAPSKQAPGVPGPISPWAYCERAAIAVETAHKLPRALLVSISMAESGRFDSESGETHPWPWTINAEGQSFYFPSKRAAVAATSRLLKAGIRSIDVGCMQVNLRYHPDAFATLNDAFDPVTNATYAAGFVKKLHAQTQSWPKAVAQYHSELPARNAPYFARVIRIWANERDRVVTLTRLLKEEAAEVAKSLRGTSDAPFAPDTEVKAVPVVVQAERPAPMVLDSPEAQDVREGASATVGLRLSIAEDGTRAEAAKRPAPRVIDTPTIVADASGGPSS